MECDYDKDKMEIFLVDGGSIDKTIEIIKEYQKKYSFFKLLHNPNKTPPYAMNLGIKEANTEYIIRLDAHSSYPKDYFSKLIFWHKKLDAQNIGALIETKVKNTTPISSAIIKVLSNKFGVGSAFRSGFDIKEPILVDTVPFGCYKKEVFDKFGLYDERLTRNQDIELNKRIVNNGGKIYLVPDIKCTYYARETLKDLAINNFNNGLWNILTAYYTKKLNSLSLRHFIPLLFIMSIILSLIFGLFYLPFLFIGFGVFLSHFILVLYQANKIVDNTTTIWDIIKTFYTLHLSYGMGSLMGIIKTIKLKFFKR